MTGKRLSVFVLARFAVMAGIAIRAKWNPENPDSGKAALREYMFYKRFYQRRRAAVKDVLAIRRVSERKPLSEAQ